MCEYVDQGRQQRCRLDAINRVVDFCNCNNTKAIMSTFDRVPRSLRLLAAFFSAKT
ncbi:DUF7692 domain-containing protein [Natrinema caseinilyticum]|uniref:DUF7692 domain-containing protein n=1 Tax=Natrinema caseinilyticum TaxID=2961570 RepID=UPI003CCCBD6E